MMYFFIVLKLITQNYLPSLTKGEYYTKGYYLPFGNLKNIL